MRFKNFIIENDVVRKALDVDEPSKRKKYDDDEINDMIDIISQALEVLKNSEKSSDKIKIRDLRDKEKKWKSFLNKKNEFKKPPEIEERPEE